ncbi:putative ABC transporter permease protein [Candidatus Promineifilum breve]|uniref:ABC transporter permease protein n=1 Tax=Candidatus Promineifilum breve TaxID=1806508 RepID=A0A160T2M2_9CHLR|nr:branched-chain amino acid ABC transporter permease [Candidatus Promineifilum breve]CUS04361.2 putative ABC transporter permease protein [Candidatus Promineifilum breve]
MNWQLVPQQFVTGLLNGGIIAIIALGIVLIYRSSEVFNFSHGQLVMLGAFLTWWFAGGEETGGEFFNLPLWGAIPLAILVMAGLGLLIERLALRPMTGQPLLAIVLMTLGLAQFLEGSAAIVFGIQPKNNFPAPFSPSDVITIPFPGAFNDAIIVKQALLATAIVAILAGVIFMLFFQYTRTGLAMRATSEDHELARSVGINVPRVFGLSWGIAGVIATVGGVLLATLTGVNLSLATVALVAFPAILLGGLESFPGAIVGGLLVGLAQALVQASSVQTVRSTSEIAPYILLLVVLVIRPEGLFGEKRIDRV